MYEMNMMFDSFDQEFFNLEQIPSIESIFE